MRVVHFHEPLIGVIAEVPLSVAQDQTWQRARISAFKNVCEIVQEREIDCVLISGRLFGDEYVTNAVITEVLEVIANTACPIIWMPGSNGKQYLQHKNNIPNNLIVLDDENPSYVAGELCIRNWSAGSSSNDSCNILFYDRPQPMGTSMLKILYRSVSELTYIITNEAFYIRGENEFKKLDIRKIEKAGFDDSASSGFFLLNILGGKLIDSEIIEQRMYNFTTVKLEIEDEDNPKSVLRKCMKATAGLADHDFVRIVLTGNITVETFINTEELRNALKNRFFYIEIFNSCELELDEDIYTTDISLRSEFIRMVMADDSLSENEKSRIIQCGWNALRGKELSE